jgi:hypothetical protein
VGCKIQNLQVLPEDSAKKDISFGDPAQSPDGKLVAVRSLHEGLAIRDPDTRAVRSPIGKTKVIGVRFVDSTDLVFLNWDRGRTNTLIF